MSVGGLAEQGERGRNVNQKDLPVRLASAAVLAAVALGAAYVGGVVAGIAAAAFALIVHLEWTAITGGGTRRATPFAAAVAAAILVAGAGMVVAGIAVAAGAAVAALALSRDAWLPGGVVYAAVFGLGLMAIRVAPDLGFEALFVVLVVVWATDSGAFFAGRLVGGARLWPRVSPQKTWAGAIGGLVTAVAAGVAAARLVDVPVTSGLIAVAAILSVFCQIGDLFESAVKRRFGTKDSGNIVPGHGGMMDRVDGLTFAAAAAAVIGAGHGGVGGIGRGLLIW